jgi:hypothetical protein
MVEDFLSTVAQYRAGLEAEMALLHQLEALSADQRRASLERNFEALTAINDTRDGTLANLVTIEHELKPIRQRLAEQQYRLAHHPEFRDVARLHRQAAELVAVIVSTDRESLAALQEAEEARREASAALEKGESTLAAYRRVIAPALANATLLNRRG